MKVLNGEIEVDDYLYESFDINPDFIDEEFVRVPSDLAYWSAKFAIAHKAFLEAKVAVKQIEAAAWFEVKDEMISERGKATEADTKAGVANHETVREAHAVLIAAEYERESLKGTLEAVRSKRDMLVSLGAHIRATMKAGPSIREED